MRHRRAKVIAKSARLQQEIKEALSEGIKKQGDVTSRALECAFRVRGKLLAAFRAMRLARILLKIFINLTSAECAAGTRCIPERSRNPERWGNRPAACG
jgi:hypothetical protein